MENKLNIVLEKAFGYKSFRKGQEEIVKNILDKKNTFQNYLQSEPKLIVSDMMPLGYVYKPTLPIECFKSPNEIEVDKKDIRKRIL